MLQPKWMLFEAVNFLLSRIACRERLSWTARDASGCFLGIAEHEGSGATRSMTICRGVQVRRYMKLDPGCFLSTKIWVLTK